MSAPEQEPALGGTGGEFQTRARDRKRNPDAVDAKRLIDGQAWEDFCDALKRAGRGVLDSGVPATPLDRAEGFRYLANLTANGLRHIFDLADPERPRFLRNPDSTSKWGAENADNQYLLAQIRPDRRYRISGRRNTAWGFLLEVKEGYMQLGDARNFATFDASEVQVEADGSFEIFLGGEPREHNWIPLDPDATQLLIRQYMVDWDREEPAEFYIEEQDTAGTPPEPLEPAQVARWLDDAGTWIETTVRVWDEWVAQLREAYRPDEIAPAQLFVGGADDIRYGNDYFRLGPEEALLIEVEPPDARYWAFQLVDNWFGSMDYANRVSSLNQAQLHLDADGRARFVVAHRDPGCPNWLDTGGHAEAVLQYRYIWTRNAPLPTKRIVPFAELWAHLPDGTPRISEAERRAQIARRQAHVRRRDRAC
jgi:hypothetical protein